MKNTFTLLSGLLLASILSPFLPAQGAMPISACGEITQSGSYVVTKDLASSGTSCLNIHDVTNFQLDCQGHTIDSLNSRRSGVPYGTVLVTNSSTFSIQNCVFTATGPNGSGGNHFPALSIMNSTGAIISGNTIGGIAANDNQSVPIPGAASNFQITNNAVTYGISMYFAVNSLLQSNTIDATGLDFDSGGIGFAQGHDNRILNNTIDGRTYSNTGPIHGTDDGILLNDEVNDIVQGNTIMNIFDAGIETEGTSRNTQIIGNNIRNAYTTGIGAYWGTNWIGNVVSNNLVKDCPSMFQITREDSMPSSFIPNEQIVYFTDNVFSGNTFTGNAMTGSLFGFSGNTSPQPIDPSKIMAVRNSFSNNDFGINTPIFYPTSMVIDLGGNICTQPSDPTYPLHCASSPTGSASATFIKTDTTTQGTWKGAYGADGVMINSDINAPPSYARVTFANNYSYAWAPSTTDPRALQKGSGSDRIASTWYTPANAVGSTYSIDMNLTDGAAHQVALYALDWDNYGPRSETIEVRDFTTGRLLDIRPITNFVGGQYLVWTLKGHVVFNVINNKSGANGVLSGVFFGGASAQVSSSASFIKTDATTQGTWKGAYGVDGVMINSDINMPPSYAQVNFANQGSAVWANSSTDIRVLQKGAANDRIASTWYSATSFSIDINLTDGAAHQVALYALDFDAYGPRNETIEVHDFATGTLLDSRAVTSFVGGQYLVWTLKGHVTFKVINNVPGSNSVIGGVFFGGAGSVTPVNQAPTGYQDSSSCTDTRGWSCDPDAWAQALEVDFYDGPENGGGHKIGSAIANQPGNAGVTAACGNTPNHNFIWPTPTALQDGQSHPVYAYAVNIGPAGSDVPLNLSPQTITGCQSSQPVPNVFVTGTALGTLRNNWSGWVGMQFTVGSQPITVTTLARTAVSGNTASHQVKIVQASNGADVPGAIVLIPPFGVSGKFFYEPLPVPVTLAANTVYYIASHEINGGDYWYDDNTTLSINPVATVDTPAFSADSGPWYFHGVGASHSYVPVNFIYQTAGLTGQLTGITTVPPTSVRVYPSPWRADHNTGTPIHFDGLPITSTVKIFTISGEWVRTLTTQGTMATWSDLANDKGDKVASGIYIYLVTDGQGGKTRGKFAIIR
jgi:hypothetical protein